MCNCICFDFTIKGELSFIDEIYQIAIFKTNKQTNIYFVNSATRVIYRSVFHINK